MRPGLMGRPKPSGDAIRRYEADLAYATRKAELLSAAREAETQFRQAEARRAPETELHRLALDLDAALSAAMYAAYAAVRIYRRKARAKPRVHALIAEAEHLLTLRETHRLNGIPEVPAVTGPLPSAVPEA
jgi:hypothetical protein